ncbi:uncharacterized protein [Oryza sativa Japonica Group]|uniref:uncharacterized protein n=1 Tax=Oryza sativa subsp. japonica TaxID=39947 RepID=UPI0001C7D82D
MAAMGNVAAVGGGAVGGRRVAELEQEADAEEDECAAAGDANDGGGVERLRRRLAAEGRWRKATLEELEKDRCAAADEAELEQEADAEEDECAAAGDTNSGGAEEGDNVERLRRRLTAEGRWREVALEELEKERRAAASAAAELEQEADAEEDECATASDANGGDMEEGGSVERLRRRFVTEERRREVALEPGGAREGEARGGVRGRRG